MRVALGASRTDVLRLVLLGGMRLTALGVLPGLALSFALTRFLAGELYGIGANDLPGYRFEATIVGNGHPARNITCCPT